MRRDLLASPGAPLAHVSPPCSGRGTPFAKLLLGDGIAPWLLAGLLYLGSGIGLGIIHLGRRAVGLAAAEAPLRRADLPWLALVVLSGGAIGPVLLMIGLTTTPASSTALLLNLESLATMVIAWVVFRENVDRRLLVGAAAILAGAVLLSWQGGPGGFGPGAIAIAGACVAWGLDNNLTRKLSAADPVQIALIKGLVAGAVNLAFALMAGCLSAEDLRARRGHAGRLSRIRGQPGLIRPGAASSGSSEDGCIFFDGPLYRGDSGRGNLRRANHRSPLRRRLPDGNRPLSAPVGSPRTRTSARGHRP